MGGISSAIDWWDEWKLRILVLCSLFVQFFLFLAGHVRLSYALRWLRVIAWLAYMGSDALAVYALATLFNRQKQQQTAADGGSGSSALEVLWAPVLLIHLGGQPTMTAYSLEDNELWKRHAITLVSQVTVALYVFCKWWSGEKRLLKAAIFLFIVGILKFSQKPWALQRASYGSMTSAYLSSLPRRAEEESNSLWRWVGKFLIAVCTCADFSDIYAQLKGKPEGGVGEKGINYSLEEYVKKALAQVKESVKAPRVVDARKKFNNDQVLVWKDIYKMFLGLATPYSVRLYFLQTFLNLDGQNQHKVLRQCIYLQFRAIYTKVRLLTSCLGICTFCVLPSLPLASAVLFAKSDKDGYDKSDITVTYILFFGTVAMEFAPVLVPIFMTLLWQSLIGCKLVRYAPVWQQDMVSQHNIMSFCVRKKKPPTLMKIAPFSYLRDYINKHWYIWYEPEAQHISVLVRHHAEEHGWKKGYIHDAATYRRFNYLRGEYTLMKSSHHLLDKLGWTFNLPFDEYVLLWHLATVLCLHHPTDNNASASTSQASISSHHRRHLQRHSVIISNYMIYLLFICPEMLIPGARQDLFILACDDIEHIIKNQSLPSLDERSIAQQVLRMGQDGNERMRESRMISDAYKLAKTLIDDLDNDTQMWGMIQGVWVEMLCYSASRCCGYLHAKSLGLGGEFLTNIWLLWWCMGMQTLPEMMNNLGPPEELTAPASHFAIPVEEVTMEAILIDEGDKAQKDYTKEGVSGEITVQSA